MPETIVVIFDNGMFSQNQDYLPSRFVAQQEVVESLISRKFEDNQENTIGIVPLVQVQANDIVTPTKQRSYIKTFLNKIMLNSKTDIMNCLSQCIHIFNQRDAPGCTLVVLLGTKMKDVPTDELFARIYEILTLGINIKMVFFGEALGMSESFKKIGLTSFSCIDIEPNEDLSTQALSFICGGGISDEDDPELAEAIRLSLEEHQRQKK
ncbi:regulatory complex subunit of 26S proteasome [Ordospora colligata]|uniref:Regulatory complex subunit of 26S proteasome n=1 Tax=Ordospora colligata OC4 TaxID=1354746 RepID=A0A0B2UK64_9MICR|nr:regulatory complex subunit of 26S proteasome [Ordospora colligata OC4]KHN69629.1 regulatory complex subunit of 26S proteasome [Ordospora colligata OC4]TBU15748.1 regulatory complex subunit of 26S proteasome [Ordospora colligata]TBU15876.1 regulatory complex subunit of 26S proteasome [Ordospora colligata]TBU18770.1 regulatory complex subunit of 26S proteasome [Ordospora colligata]